MGHERLGTLPKTKRWVEILQQLGSLYADERQDLSAIVQGTAGNVEERFRNIHRDSGIQAAFRFLVVLSLSHRQPDRLVSPVPQNITVLGLATLASSYIEKNLASREYGELARTALIDALAEWHGNASAQGNLFAEMGQTVWSGAATAGGFSELSRLFFAHFTERYLRYFLERHASETLRSFEERERFDHELSDHCASISRHAFETAKIAQSFAAGWHAKYATGSIPSDRTIQNFLAIAFGKIRDELRRETADRD